jgi:deoxyadenosine/deoxycytidine kinase
VGATTSTRPQFAHVSVIGNIGAGKTTAVRALGDELGAAVYEERLEENPYLSQFYEDPPRWAALNQLWFLTQAAEHHAAIAARTGVCIQEQTLDTIFGVMTAHVADRGALATPDLELLERVYRALGRDLPPPTLLLRLRAPIDVLLTRIAARGRPFERSIDAALLASIERRLDRFTRGWTRCPVVELDTAAVDVRTRAGRAALAQALEQPPES